jgi:hypothetical protein
LGLVLLIISGLLIRSFARIVNTDSGFDPRQILTERVGFQSNRLPHDQRVQLYQQLIQRILSKPGVRGAAAGWPLPMSTGVVTIPAWRDAT